MINIRSTLCTAPVLCKSIPLAYYLAAAVIHMYIRVKVKVKVKQSRYRPGVAQRIPGS
jgi:hypothetical protein